jgi:subtilase family serine protease
MVAAPPLQVLPNQVSKIVNGQSARFLGPLPDSQKMQLTIVLPLRNQDQLDQLLVRLYDPGSSDYHKFLSVEEFTDRFGPTEDDYQEVVEFATANGFAVTVKPGTDGTFPTISAMTRPCLKKFCLPFVHRNLGVAAALSRS